MTAVESLPLLALAGLGALHGINPGMGWLFAVGLGLQEQHRRAVWRALLPLAAGHALAIGAAVGTAAALGLVIPLAALKWGVALLLVGLGLHRLVRHRHPRYGGMQVNRREIATWSFLMASAHGAGLMVLPLVLGAPAEAASHAHHAGPSLATLGDSGALLSTLAHSAGYLIVTAIVAVVVYEKVGLRLLRSAWINLDLIWAGALVVTGVVAVV